MTRRPRYRLFVLLWFAAVLGGAGATPAVDATTSRMLATAAPANQVIIVPPTGGDDTDNIDQAFIDAVDAGPGSVVEFLPGVYCITRPILVRSFDGVMRGAGVGMTTIRTCTDPDPFPLADFGVIDPAHPADPPYPALPRVFVFVEVEGKPATSIEVHDLTFELVGKTEPWQQGPFTWLSYSRVFAFHGKRPGVAIPDLSTIDVEIDRVEVLAQLISSPGFPVITNLFQSFGINDSLFVGASGPISAAVTTTSSRFVNSDRMWWLQDLVDSTIQIGGTPNAGNLMEGLTTNPFIIFNVQGSTIDVAHNDFPLTQTALRVQSPADATETTHVRFAHNHVTAAFFPFAPPFAVYVLDNAVLGGERSLDVVIEDNEFHGAPDLGFPGSGPLDFAVRAGRSDGVVVRNNRFSGQFNVAAVAFGTSAGLPNGKCEIHGNNVEHVSVGLAPVWLGPGSFDCTYIGNPNEVLDQGTNNRVVRR